MQKLRLVTFGCSFTYGQGLPDCLSNDDGPSEYSWTKLLGKKLDRDVYNISSPGSSNLEILHQILNFDFNESDLVVVMWTVFDRDTIFLKRWFKKNTVIHKVGAWCTDKYSKKLLNRVETVDQAIKSWINIHHADLHLKSKNVRYMHFPAIAGHLEPYQPSFIKVNNIHHYGLVWTDYTADNHPGVESNKLTAERIYDLIINDH